MALEYTVDENNVVKIFEKDKLGSITQPNWPDGDAWIDVDEAANWAKLYIASIEDENAPFAPSARGKAGKPKPTPEQRVAIQNAQKAIKEAKTPEEKQAAQEALINAYSA